MSSLRKIFSKASLISLFFIAAMSWCGESSAAQLNLTWTDNSTNEDGFKIERRAGTTGSFTQIVTVGTNITSYTDLNLTAGAIYCYRVRAYNSAGDSAYSNDSCASAAEIDTDGDGLTDYMETNTYGTDPLLADTDGDGLSDDDELFMYVTNPSQFDSNGNGIGDGLEITRSWTDYQVRLTMRSDDNDDLGVMFRYQDNNNYYRFSWNRQKASLVKRENGVFTVLAEDNLVSYAVGQTYQFDIVVNGTTLEVSIDGALIFSVTDSSFTSGTVGLYSWANEGSHFDDVVVENIVTGTVLLSDDFNDDDFNNWTIVNEGMIDGPSSWSATMGTLTQSSNLHSDGGDLERLGTYAVYNSLVYWTDYRVSLTMRSDDNDAIGVMFRYQDNNNYYRFSWDGSRGYRRLVKQKDGVFTVLAEGSINYVQGRTYQVEVVVEGSALEISIDGVLLYSAVDPSFNSGGIGLYTWGNEGGYFDDVLVEDLATGTVILSENFDDGDFYRWTIVNEGTIQGQSEWTVSNGTAVQKANTYSNQDEYGKLATYLVPMVEVR